ncbi:MAG: lactate racemase domain-containing protein [Clostridia bacterium]|nr:lactate racemase domain-containing protein [Clostridia bacterium]
MILPEAVRNLQLPKMVKVEQVFADEHLEDTAAAVKAQAAPFAAQMREGASAAVLVGSRGVTDINLIAKAVVDTLRDAGVKPVIIPAMGSHGGGTSEGQEEILKGYGITAETMDVPINSSMETEIIGQTEDGMDVHFSKPALAADYVIPIGRVKPHTDFTGKVESGLCKMLAIGGGKHNGCSRIHREGFPALAHTIPDAAEVIIGRVDIPFGLAVIENAFEKTHTVEAVPGKNILTREPKLLDLAKSLMPRIKYDDIDVLIVERIGKEISGTGMDPNIIGRDAFGQLPGAVPRVQRIIIEDLTEGAHGNAIGFGMADFILRSALDKIDLGVTYTNGIASGNTNGMKIPVIMDSEEEAIRAALQTCIGIDLHHPKIVKIKDTLHLSEIEVSENML